MTKRTDPKDPFVEWQAPRRTRPVDHVAPLDPSTELTVTLAGAVVTTPNGPPPRRSLAAAVAERRQRIAESPLVEAYNRLDEAVADLEDFVIESGYPDPVFIHLGQDAEDAESYATLTFDRNDDDKKRGIFYVVSDSNGNTESTRPLRDVSRNRKMLALGKAPELVETVTTQAAKKVATINVLVTNVRDSIARARGGK